MKSIKCFFIGHRDTPKTIYPELIKEIENHIVFFGVNEFIVGHYGSFDLMAGRAVFELKAKYPAVKLVMLLPYLPVENRVQIPDYFDDSLYPDNMEKVPKKYAIIRANRYAVDISDYLIAYVSHPGSSARDILEYASKRKHTTNIYTEK